MADDYPQVRFSKNVSFHGGWSGYYSYPNDINDQGVRVVIHAEGRSKKHAATMLKKKLRLFRIEFEETLFDQAIL